MQEQYTRKQHYVPQVYLRGFSQGQNRVYVYRTKTGSPISVPVPINEICKKDNLYEIKNNKGEYIYRNLIEESLCGFEGQFATYKRLLERKSIKENFQTRSFLSKEEKIFWTVYLTLQVMRNPIILKGTANIIKDELPESTEIDARNLAIATCLPLFKETKTEDQNAFLYFLSLLINKRLSVGYAENDRLFTSDITVHGYSPNTNEFDFVSLHFPISSQLILIASDPKSIEHYQYNRLIPLSDTDILNLNKGIAYHANQMIISKYPFTDEELKLIEEARKERKKDEINIS